MRLSRFGYVLPEELIAQNPLHLREKARLLVVNRSDGIIYHDVFSNLNKYLPKEAVIVLNNSKVVPARLLGFKERTKGQVEIFLLNKMNNEYFYEVLLRPSRRIKDNDIILFPRSSLKAIVVDKEKRIVRFNKKNISKDLQKVGHMPLPPYIKRPDKAEDKKYYQTVFAKKEGSVASPTAGLHFTSQMLRSLKKAGHGIEQITLHINYATFKPVEEKDITQHKMHYENYSLSKGAYINLLKAKEKGKKIVAVGTTSCRVLETVAKRGNLSGDTNIFMYPGYKFKMTDALITNFHLPYSTLLMLVYAFGGEKLIKRAYEEAIKRKYRFYSYGDAMLIL